ncbi:restriction endonuclease subunit S [Gallibacterium melopsittaci]|uniref:Restriction endonuclease subunit S n=1 Tax=Gallibacterium melopsittaci TaxID=516063 RepID=A0ABV6HYF9_9PAST
MMEQVLLSDVVETANTGLDAIRRAPIVNFETDIRCLRIQDISQNKDISHWGFTEVKPQDWEKYQLIKDDIIMARTCSTGISFLVRQNMNAVFNNGLLRIRVKKDKVLPEYIYYVFKSQNFANYIDGISGGTSVQLNMKIGDVLKYPLFIPSFDIQDKIVKQLSVLDKKIQLNTETNQTLEAIAQAIFKHWFIDFAPVHAKANALANGQTTEQAELAAMASISGKNIEQIHALAKENSPAYEQLKQTAAAFPSEFVESELGKIPKGWEIDGISNVCRVVYGKGLPKNKLKLSGYPVYGANGVIGYHDTYLYKDRQVLIGCRGTVGKVSVSAPFSFITSNSLIVEYSNSSLNLFFLENYLKNIDLSIFSSGSVQPQITIQNLSKLKVLIPSKNILDIFDMTVKHQYFYIYKNTDETYYLSEIRDTLLPKLLNGEIEL